MTTFNRMRSTDRDLLAIQKKLGGIRYPNLDQSKLDQLTDNAAKRLVTRFIEEKVGREIVKRQVAQVSNRRLTKMYTLILRVQLRNIPIQLRQIDVTQKVTASVAFTMAHVVGHGPDPDSCLYAAKETYRKHLGNELRDKDSKLRATFLRKIELSDPAGATPLLTKEQQDEAKEQFRLWFSKSIRDASCKTYKDFFNSVQHEEERYTIVCKGCNKRCPDISFFTKDGFSDNCSDCREKAKKASQADNADVDEDDDEDDEELDDEDDEDLDDDDEDD